LSFSAASGLNFAWGWELIHFLPSFEFAICNTVFFSRTKLCADRGVLGYIVAMSDYWLARDGQQFGPYSIEELQQRVAQGLADATDLVWTEGMPAWDILSKVVPIRRGPPPPPPPAVLPPSPSPTPHYVAPPAGADTNLYPPAISWWVVILFSFMTFGIFAWIWCLKEARFAKKLDPHTSAWILMLIAVIAYAFAIPCYIGMISIGDSDVRSIFALLELLCSLTGGILFIVAGFQIRRAMVTYYNTVEPIGLRMSGAMTFFFNIIYIQYHFDRIATWKRTGFLQPQR
jgi:hypothetical protein